VAREWSGPWRDGLWRSYCDRLNARLLERWLPEGVVDRALKTDMFDEAVSGRGLCGVLAGRARIVVGIDLSPAVIGRAAYGAATVPLVADVRRLPFADRAFDVVLSNSTLDHFSSLAEVAIALAELRRVLKPGGHLLLTLDNLANPAVAVRNALPMPFLLRLKLVPYFTGATCGPGRLEVLAREAGLHPMEMEAMMHCPRLPAVVLSRALARLGWDRAADGFVRGLLAWERLAGWPTRYRTGYFVALKAVRTPGD
jgi:SAM-dependent methyltransferase